MKLGKEKKVPGNGAEALADEEMDLVAGGVVMPPEGLQLVEPNRPNPIQPTNNPALYVTKGNDWDKEDISAEFISQPEDEAVPLLSKQLEEPTAPSAGKFATLNLKHF